MLQAEDPDEPAQAGRLGAARSRRRRAPRRPSGDREHDAGELRHVRHEPDERPADDAQERERERADGIRRARRCRSTRYATTAPRLGEAVLELVDEQRQEEQADDQRARRAARERRRGRGAARGARCRASRSRNTIPSTCSCVDRARRPDRERPPACPAARPGLPGRGQREHREEPDRVRVPDEGRLLDRGRGDREERAGHEARDRPATRPPIDRASHHVSATAAIPRSAMNAVTATGSPPEIAAAGASRK